MAPRKILASILLCIGLHASGQAGDNDCVVQYYLGKVNDVGTYTMLMDCVPSLSNEATVSLAPGEQVRITRHCPGCVYCPDSEVGLERRAGTGPGHASIAVPVLDTLPLSTSVGTDIAEPGSYYLLGIAPNDGLSYYAASLRLIIQSMTTGVDEVLISSFNAWAVPGGVALENVPAGVLSVMDISGKLIHNSPVAADKGIQTIALQQLPTGSYLITVVSDKATLRRRIVID